MTECKDGHCTNLAEKEVSRIPSFFPLLSSFPVFLEESQFSGCSSHMCGTRAKKILHPKVEFLSEAPQRESVVRGGAQGTTGTDKQTNKQNHK